MNLGVLLIRPLLPARSKVVVREANTPSRHARDPLGRLFFWLGYRMLYRWAHRVICPAAYISDELTERYHVRADRIVTLPNPVDETSIRAAAHSVRRAPGVGLRFVCVGRLSEQKGYDRLLDDWTKMPADARLVIFGDGELHSALNRQIERLGIGGRVALAGFEPQPAPWVAGADALLLPSRWEGLPNVALEALACGTPVIATPEAGGIGEIAGLASPGAVTLAAAGETFVAAMLQVVPRPDVSLRPSLLPDAYRLERAAAAFEAALAA
jgi:glycosyltransferase involved in cell wall biosynthesis